MEAFQKNHVVPDVIEHAPNEVLEVEYPHGVKVDLGNVLTPTQVQHEPRVHWHADPNCYYTLIMTDPDAPSRADPKAREWHHWLVVNIPGNKIHEGEVKAAYVGAGPPKGTDLHRYVFLVYKQPNKLDMNIVTPLDKHTASGRPHFSAKNFAKRFHYGPLIAGNFFQAEWDDYVPHLYQQLKH